MIAGSRRAARDVPGRLRVPRRAGGEPREPTRPEADQPRLRLAAARGRLALEIEHPFWIGPVRWVEGVAWLEGLRFPLDLGGGVARFRHRRGRLAGGRLEVDLVSLARWVASRVGPSFGGTTPKVTLGRQSGGVFVGIEAAGRLLAFDLLVAPLERDVRLLVASPRGHGLDEPARSLAVRLLAQLTRGLGASVGGAVSLVDPIARLARAAWPLAGARVPATEGVSLALDEDATTAHRLAFTLRLDEPDAPLAPRTLATLELVELAGAAEAASLVGDHEQARRALLAALERAPRHAELARALAELDLRVFDRPEAALSTLVDAVGAVDAGLLGSVVLERVGELEAAYAAASRAAAEEPWGPLAARAWLEAARLSSTEVARSEAIDQALARDPASPGGRWMRLEARLAQGDLRGAIADADHLELSAEGPDERHEVARRAAAALRARGFLDEARARYERAIRWAPRSVHALVGLSGTLSELGRGARALDLLARAAALESARDDATGEVQIALGRALVLVAKDRPSAVARVAAVPPHAELAPEARAVEAEWRADLGDRAGASRAIERLWELVERRLATASAPRAEELSRLLESAATLAAERLDDRRAVERSLALALRCQPSSAHLARRLRAAAEPAPAPPDGPTRAPAHALHAIEVPAAAPAPVVVAAPLAEVGSGPSNEPALDAGDAEQRVEQLSQGLRADPSDDALATELAGLLERLDRDLDLLALVSARLEEAPESQRPPWRARQRAVLGRLATHARAEGRADEAALYESLAAVD